MLENIVKTIAKRNNGVNLLGVKEHYNQVDAIYLHYESEHIRVLVKKLEEITHISDSGTTFDVIYYSNKYHV